MSDEQELEPVKKKRKYRKRTGRLPKEKKLWLQKLSQDHYRVVENYMRGMNRKEAMLAAGYSQSTAEKGAWKIFGREDVQGAIEERRWRMRTRTHEMVDRIQEELARLAFFNIGEVLEITDDGDLVFDFTEATMEQMAAIGEVTVETFNEGKGRDAIEVKRVKVKPYDKKAALDSLARIFGMFQDNLAISPGEGGSLEERLARGRERMNKENEAIEGEFEEVAAG